MEKITRISIKSNIELRKQSPNKSSISDKNYGKQKKIDYINVASMVVGTARTDQKK